MRGAIVRDKSGAGVIRLATMYSDIPQGIAVRYPQSSVALAEIAAQEGPARVDAVRTHLRLKLENPDLYRTMQAHRPQTKLKE